MLPVGRPGAKPLEISHLCCGAKNKASARINSDQLSLFLTAVTSGDSEVLQYFKNEGLNEGLQADSFVAQIFSSLNQENSEPVTIDSLSKIGAINDLIEGLSTLSSGSEILVCAQQIIELQKIKSSLSAYLEQRSAENNWVCHARNKCPHRNIIIAAIRRIERRLGRYTSAF